MKKLIIVFIWITTLPFFQVSFAQELKKTTVLKRTTGKPTPRTKVAPQRQVAAPRRPSPSALKRGSVRSTVQPTSKLKKTITKKKTVTPSRKPAPKIESCRITPEIIEIQSDITKIGDEFGKTVDEETYNVFRLKISRLRGIFHYVKSHSFWVSANKAKTQKDKEEIGTRQNETTEYINKICDDADKEIKASIEAGKSDDPMLESIISNAYTKITTKIKETTNDPHIIEIINAEIKEAEERQAKIERTHTLSLLNEELKESQKALQQETSPEKKRLLKNQSIKLKIELKT